MSFYKLLLRFGKPRVAIAGLSDELTKVTLRLLPQWYAKLGHLHSLQQHGHLNCRQADRRGEGKAPWLQCAFPRLYYFPIILDLFTDT